MNKFQSTLIAAAASAAALGLTGMASAAETDAPPSLLVHYNADTFASDASTKAFYRVLVKAAERVCVDQPRTRPWVSDSTLACRKQALDGALSQVKNTRLATIAGLTKNG